MNGVRTELWASVAGGVVRADDPGIKPNKNGLPGMDLLKEMAGGLMFAALIFCGIALLASAIVWAIGSFGSNHHTASRGKTGVLVSVGAAVIVGGANALIGWGSGMGGRL